jgi:FkbM family methyltransferase
MNNIIKILRYLLFIPILTINKLLFFYARIILYIDPNGNECKLEELYQNIINKKINSNLKLNNIIDYNPKLKKRINFYTPNKLSSYRACTYLSKEKDTILWIDKFGSSKNIFFDVGSNIGVYSLYYASLYGAKVFAFEPQYNNATLLSRNLKLNNLQNYVTIIPNPLYKNNKIDFLFSSSNNEAASASTTFIKKNIYISKNFDKKLTMSYSIDFLVKNNLIPQPNIIKIDVDGNELDVIKGARKTINEKKCKSILIEKTNKISDHLIDKILSKSFYLYKHSGLNSIYVRR